MSVVMWVGAVFPGVEVGIGRNHPRHQRCHVAKQRGVQDVGDDDYGDEVPVHGVRVTESAYVKLSGIKVYAHSLSEHETTDSTV